MSANNLRYGTINNTLNNIWILDLEYMSRMYIRSIAIVCKSCNLIAKLCNLLLRTDSTARFVLASIQAKLPRHDGSGALLNSTLSSDTTLCATLQVTWANVGIHESSSPLPIDACCCPTSCAGGETGLQCSPGFGRYTWVDL